MYRYIEVSVIPCLQEALSDAIYIANRLTMQMTTRAGKMKDMGRIYKRVKAMHLPLTPTPSLPAG